MVDSFPLLDDALEEEIIASEDPGKYLILEAHPEAPGHWLVQSLTKGFRFDLREVIGDECIVSPASLEEFLEAAAEDDYKVAFGETPYTILDAYAALNDEPEVELVSHFPDTVNGFLNFQVQGFNKLKGVDGAVAQWSTGTGKSVLAAGLTKYHEQKDNFDICFYVVKAHNKVNTARGLLALAGIESVVLDGTIDKREKIYLEVMDRLERGEKTVVITNYEKFRDDFVEWVPPPRFLDEKGHLKRDRKGKEVKPKSEEYIPKLVSWIEPVLESRLWIVWDEMPTKLKSRTSRVYRAVTKCLYRTNPPATDWNMRRPAELRQVMLSATPIENDPEDWYNCVRLLDPRVYGTVSNFRDEFVAYYDHFDSSKPKGWRNLDVIALRAAHLVHQVDKRHPEIAAQFPEVIPDVRIIDWDPRDRRIYDKLTKELVKQIDDEDGIPILAAIAVMQMLCDAPAIVNDSAALRLAYEESVEAFSGDEEDAPEVQGTKGALALLEALDGKKLTNDHHTKLIELHNVLTKEFPNEKTVVFSALNQSLMPTLEALLTEWGVTYVRYEGTTKQKQDAEDRFKSDPSIQVFLSSDKGSDSINLEVARVVVNFNGPWKWTTEEQRVNRIHRITSTFGSVYFITFEMHDSIDTRKAVVRARKKRFHEGVFDGVIRDEALSANTTRDDLRWLLSG